MPTISMFEGIIISMYNRNEHYPPHFHAWYSGQEATFSLDGELLVGKIPQGKVKLIVAWAELHKDELEANWKLAMENEPLYKINPLSK